MAQSHDKLLASNVEAATTFETTDEPKRRILKPDEEMIALEDLPQQSACFYVVCWLAVAIFLALLIFQTVSISEIENPSEFVINVFVLNSTIVVAVQYTAGFLNVFCGVKTAYTRKLIHLTVFSLPFIIDALVGGFEDDTTAQLALGWNGFVAQFIFMLFTIPSRKVIDFCLGNVRDKDNATWKRALNFPSLALAGLDRAEDRPNTLKWLQIQVILSYLFVASLTFINEQVGELAVETVILVPTIIGGFGDGLAEPVGRKWGGNYQYKTHGCCTQYDYVRSYPGSAMVWLSGIVAVAFNFEEFTTIQFVIGMVVIPLMGTVVEAKAPHTLDNPFIVLFVGATVMAVAAIPL